MTKNKTTISNYKEQVYTAILNAGRSVLPSFSLDKDHDQELYLMLFYYFTEDPIFNSFQPGNDIRKGLYLHGSVGTGKTTILRVFQELYRRQRNASLYIITNVVDVVSEYALYGEESILKHVNGSFRKNMYGGLDLHRPITRCYDDLGTESLSIRYFGNERNVMAHILLKRYELYMSYGMKTIITTNLDADSIEKYYGRRIRSRLREMCNQITIDGADRR